MGGWDTCRARASDKRPSEAPLVQSGPSDGVCFVCSAKRLCPLRTLPSQLHLSGGGGGGRAARDSPRGSTPELQQQRRL